MSQNVLPLSLSQGETRVEKITVTDLEGDPLNLTDCFLYLVVRELDDSLVSALCKATDSGIAHEPQTGATLGQAVITWAHGDSAAVPPGQYRYIVYVVDAVGQRQVVVDWSPLEVLDGEPVLPPVV